jgi:16S rRNA (cytosine967-C5)-methyltransferase
MSYKVSPARQVAFEILRRVLLEDAFASNLLTSTLTLELSFLDRSLTQEIVLGVLRNLIYIDFSLEKLSGKVLSKLDLEVLISLRIGFYQIYYLSKIPNHAIVNDSVNLVKLHKKASASGFVNAVLRKVAREKEALKQTPLGDYKEIALKFSHPAWLIKKWVNAFGEQETIELARANNSPPPVYFRINKLKTNIKDLSERLIKTGIEFSSNPLVEGAFLVISDKDNALLKFAAQGLIHIQDAASQMIANLLDAKAGMQVFDTCAAPGGKTTLIASQMDNKGLIIAGDFYLSRVKLIRENAKRLGVKIIFPICYDAKESLPTNSKFDRVLIDAPCSGTGTLKHNPEIKLRLSEDKILELSHLQSVILNNCALQVKVYGKLVYSTCSLEYEENEGVIEKFLSNNSDFRILAPKSPFLTKEGYIRTWPYKDNMDGFFAAVLEKVK